LARVLGHGLGAPVAILDEAVTRDDTVLLGLLGASLLRGGNPDIGAGDGVLAERLLVDVEGEAGGVLVDVTRDANFVLLRDLKRNAGAVLNEDLGTALVELGITSGSIVQGEDLGADQVVARGQAGRQVNRKQTVVGSEAVGTPGALLDVVAVLPDLEPSSTGSRVGEDVVNLLDVDGAGALVSLGDGSGSVVGGSLTEVEGELGTAGGRANELGRLVAISACKSLSVTGSMEFPLEQVQLGPDGSTDRKP
jgi:hypothetical protein